MSKTVLEKDVLVLNRHWQAVNVITVQNAFSMMAAEAATGLAISEDCQFTPVQWKDWLALDVRESDDFVGTPRGRVRVPRVIIAVNFARVPKKRPHLSMAALRERDGNRCAYTRKLLKPEECSMDHVIPASKGGQRVWENIVLAHREVNSKRGNRSLKEAGLTLHVTPHAPKERLTSDLIRNRYAFPEWDYFLAKKREN